MSAEQDEQQIRNLIATWMQASASGDLNTVLKLMAEDVVFLRAGRPPMSGRESFAAAMRSMAGKMRIEGRPEIREIRVAGDYAFCWSYLLITATPIEGGEPKRRAGDILSVYRREPDGSWVLYRDANLLTAQ